MWQTAGIEAAINATTVRFSYADTKGILLVDASNAFYPLSRKAALLTFRNSALPLLMFLSALIMILHSYLWMETSLTLIKALPRATP